MDEKRKETIIKEIKYWRKSKLLPEQYCDFLLTLYSEGEEAVVDSKEKVASSFLTMRSLLPFIMVQAMFFLAVLIIYFTDFSIVMQIMIGIFFTIAIVFIANKVKAQYLLLTYLFLLMAALLLFLLTVHIVVNVFQANSLYLAAATFVHCIVWFLIGWKWRIRFFTVAGVLGMIVLLFFLF